MNVRLRELRLKEIGASSSALQKLLNSFPSDTRIEILDIGGNYFTPR